MKALFLHCNRVEVQREWELNSWDKALLVLICPEDTDNKVQKKKLLDSLLSTLTQLDESKVVLSPFPYISYNSSEQKDISDYLGFLKKKLLAKNKTVAQFDFETAEKVHMNLIGHKVSVAYREFKK